MGASTSGVNSIDICDADTATSVTKVEPVNSAGSFGAYISSSRGLDAIQLLGNQNLVSFWEVKDWDTGGVEVMVANEGKLSVTLELQWLVLREGFGGRGSNTARVEVERDLVVSEGLRSEKLPG